MKLAEVRKALVAGAALIATAAPQLLVFGDLLPPSAAVGITVVAILAGIVGVWAVPNKPLSERVADTITSVQDLAPIIREMAREEVAAATISAADSSPRVEARVRPVSSNPFAIPPIGRS